MMMMIMAECQDVIFHRGVIFGMSRAGLGVGLVDPVGPFQVSHGSRTPFSSCSLAPMCRD